MKTQRSVLVMIMSVLRAARIGRTILEAGESKFSVCAYGNTGAYKRSIEIEGDNEFRLGVDTLALYNVLKSIGGKYVEIKATETAVILSSDGRQSQIQASTEGPLHLPVPAGTTEVEVIPDAAAEVMNFLQVSTGEFGFGDVRLDSAGLACASDSSSLYVTPFLKVPDEVGSVMVPVSGLFPVTRLTGSLTARVLPAAILFIGDGGKELFMSPLSTRPDPGFSQVLSRFQGEAPVFPFPLGQIGQEIETLASVVGKEQLAQVTISEGNGVVKATGHETVRFESKFETDSLLEVEFTVKPRSYLKISSLFQEQVDLVSHTESHLFFKEGERRGVISCEARSVVIKK